MAKLLADPDADVAQAAARALGKIGTPEAAKALDGALAGVSAANQVAFCEGLFRCAEALSAEGQAAQSQAIYDRLRGLPQAPQQVRAGALRGAILARQKEGIPLLLEAIRGDGLRPDRRRRADRPWRCPARRSPPRWPTSCPSCPSTSRSC